MNILHPTAKWSQYIATTKTQNKQPKLSKEQKKRLKKFMKTRQSKGLLEA